VARTADQFLDALRASRLLRPRELESALAALTADDRQAGPALAAALIRRGVLTKFQAQKILAGAIKGLVVGPYQLLAPLGRGGMGKVYLARDRRTGRPVAVKVLPPAWAREHERLLVRFRREMEISQQVDHPNLARVIDTGVDGEVHYIVMEYVPGQTLSKRVNRGGPLPPDLAARVFAEAADALAHAHERGLVHRDVKPGNLMLTPAGHAKVLDLGLALRPGEDGEAAIIGGKGIVVGTMEYIAPEQTRDAAGVDGRADLYGLGATLFYALTGRGPFPGGTSRDKIMRHRNEEPPRADEYNIDVPEGMAELIQRMLSKDPDDRPQTAVEVRERLRRWAAPPAPPDPPPDPVRVLATLANEPDAEADSTAATAEAVTRPAWVWAVIAGAVLALFVLTAVVLVTRS
jgi:serine/threonine protein kinase